MRSDADVTALVDEYKTLADEVGIEGDGSKESALLLRKLVQDGQWTQSAAEALARVATEYGTFFLRNALALAIALDVEDGSLGI
jgi:hypothetical protein